MRCQNKREHQGYWGRDMQRMYVRHTVDEKRKWVAIGWYCDPEYKSSAWGASFGCGTIILDNGRTWLATDDEFQELDQGEVENPLR